MRAAPIFTLVATVLLTAGCENKIAFDTDQSAPLPVLNCVVEADRPIEAYVGKSLFFLSNGYCESIDNASIKLYIDGQLRESVVGSNSQGGMYLFQTSAKSGEQVRIEATHPTLGTFWGETKLLDTPTITAITVTGTGKYSSDYVTGYGYDMKIAITDNSSTADYYRLDLSELYVTYNSPDTPYTWQSGNEYYGDEYRSEVYVEYSDAVFRNNGFVQQNQLWDDYTEEFYLSIFDDATFNTKGQYRLTVHLIDPVAAPNPTLKGTVRLVHLNSDYYSYCKAMVAESNTMPFAEPVQIPSNVEGGIGLVSSISSVRLDTRCQLKHNGQAEATLTPQ